MEDELFDDDNRKQSTATFNPNFYNPFEIKHRRRTSRGQFKILEKAFIDNPKPTAKFRLELAASLSMSPRGVQVWFQNRRAKAKQQQQQQDSLKDCSHQYIIDDNLIDSLKVELPSVKLTSSGMVHSSSQSSLSSSTTYSTGNHDSLHVMQINKMPQVIHQSPSLLTPPQQQSQTPHQNEWWNSIMIDNGHQTFIPAAQEVSYSFTATANTASTNGLTSADQLDAWAYIDSLDLANSHSKIDVESWITSTKEAQNDDLFAIIDNRRNSFPPTITHIVQQQQQQHQYRSQISNWTAGQASWTRRLSEPPHFDASADQSYYL